MRKRTIPALVAIAAVAALPATAGAATTVKLGDNFFQPAKTTVSKGTKVLFKWVGDRPHNVTKTRGPGGGFASRTTSQRGVNFAKRFKKAGTYRMICTIHPDEMRLKLIVG
jgi:plastocyanin